MTDILLAIKLWIISRFRVEPNRNLVIEELDYLRNLYMESRLEISLLQKEIINLNANKSFLEAVNDENELLRTRVDIERSEVKVLTDRLITNNRVFNPELDDRIEVGLEAPQPVNRPKFVPWSVKQRQLEREDRMKFQQLAKEAASNIDKEKLATATTVSQLEEVLGVE